MKKYVTILAICTTLALAACNSAEQKKDAEKSDSTKVESNTNPAPQTTNADTTQHK